MDGKAIDITGNRYGKLIAIEKDTYIDRFNVHWIFKCDCGNIKSIRKAHVISGRVVSCGCKKHNHDARIDLTGKRFGRLTVIEHAYTKFEIAYWKCRCDCGRECIVIGQHLRRKDQQSCGCFRIYKRKRGESGLKILYAMYKSKAKKKNRIFDLTLEEFKEITSKDCGYCGKKPETRSVSKYGRGTEENRHTLYVYNGIDRIDNNRGYEKDNVVPCCRKCNRMKLDYPVEEFKEHINRIYNHQQKLKNAQS